MRSDDRLFSVADIGDEQQALLCPFETKQSVMDEIKEKFKSGQSLEQIADEMNQKYPASFIARIRAWLRF